MLSPETLAEYRRMTPGPWESPISSNECFAKDSPVVGSPSRERKPSPTQAEP